MRQDIDPLTNRELAARIAELVLPAKTIGRRPLGYRIQRVRLDPATGALSAEMVMDEGMMRRNATAMELFSVCVNKVAPREKSKIFVQVATSGAQVVIDVTEKPIPEDPSFLVLSPVFSLSLAPSHDDLKVLPAGVKYAPGWASMRRRGLYCYVCPSDISRSWRSAGTPISMLGAVPALARFAFRICAFLYTTEDNKLLAYEDVSLQVAAEAAIGNPEYHSVDNAARVRAAERWRRPREQLPVGVTRVYYAESDNGPHLIPINRFRKDEPHELKVRAVQRVKNAAPIADAHDYANTAELKMYLQLAGVDLSSEDPSLLTTGLERIKLVDRSEPGAQGRV